MSTGDSGRETEDPMSESKSNSGSRRSGRIVRSLSKKILMPVVATAVSAVAGYAAKRGPQFLEEQVLPRLREAGSGAGGVARDLTERAKSVGSSAGDTAHDIADRAKSVVPGGESAASSGSASHGSDRRRTRPAASNEERERQWKARAKARAARRAALSK
jgi:hypothetical protein